MRNFQAGSIGALEKIIHPGAIGCPTTAENFRSRYYTSNAKTLGTFIGRSWIFV